METCRVCHRDDGARTIDVATLSDASQLPISLMLSYCAQVEVSNGEQICSECLMNLETAFNFRKQCRQTKRCPVKSASNKTFQCCVPSCVMTSNSLRGLVMHSTRRHTKVRKSNTAHQRNKVISTSCPICCMGFASIAAMKHHSDTQNIQWTKFRCEKCRMICQNPVSYAEHRVEADYVMECDDEDTNCLDSKMRNVMDITKSGKRFMIKLTESELYILTETIYPPKDALEELLASYNKTCKIFYICQTCGYRSMIKNNLLQHIETSQDCQGFHYALGSFDPTQKQPWLSCATCQFIATNPTSMMDHQYRFKHSGIKTVPSKSSKAEAVPDTEQCEIDEPKLSESNAAHSSAMVKVEADESSSPPVTKSPNKTKPNRQKPKQSAAVIQSQIKHCKCGLIFSNNKMLQRHIEQYCKLRYCQKSYQKATPVKVNVLQCDGCLITLYSPSDVVRHQQNSCPAYKQKQVAERYSFSGAEL